MIARNDAALEPGDDWTGIFVESYKTAKWYCSWSQLSQQLQNHGVLNEQPTIQTISLRAPRNACASDSSFVAVSSPNGGCCNEAHCYVEGDFFEAISDRQVQLHLEYEFARQTEMVSKGKLLNHRLTNQDSSVREVHTHRDNRCKVAVCLSNSPQELSD